MSKTFKRTLIITPIICLMAALLVWALAAYLAPIAMADNPIYVDANLTFDGLSHSGLDVGNAKYVVCKGLWTSTDLTNWSDAPASLQTKIVYVDQNDVVYDTPPTVAGAYTAKLVVVDMGGVSYTLANGLAVSADTVLASVSYRVVDANVNIIVGPSADLSYNPTKNHYNTIIADTKVYLDGALVNAANYTVTVVKEGDTDPTTTVTDVGAYNVTVVGKAGTAIEGYSRSAQFRVVQTASDIVKLDGAAATGVLYEGMYTSAGYTTLHDDYYGLHFAGALANNDGSINTAYATLQYMQGDVVLAKAPTTVGNYTCRVYVTAPYAQYELSVGDYVDLPYSIRSVPYLPIYEATNGQSKVDNLTFGNYYVYSSPFRVNVARFVRTNDTALTIGMSVHTEGDDAPKCYRYNGSEYVVVDSVVGVGSYRVDYTIKYADITGDAPFGTADKAYRVTDSNCTFSYYFEVIGNYTVTGIRSEYVATVDSTSAESISKLKPELKYDGASAVSVLDFAYTRNGIPTTLQEIQSNATVGQYKGVATFKSDWVVKGKTIAKAGDTFRFGFSISVPRYSVMAYDNISALDALSKVQEVYSAAPYSVQDGDVVLSYYRVHNGIYSVITQGDLCVTQGTYMVNCTLGTGRYAGSILGVLLSKPSAGRKNDIKFDIVGLGEASAIDYTGNLFAATVDYDSDYYTLYYERKSGLDNGAEQWKLCDYPDVVGDYRVVMRFDKANTYYDAAYGDTISREFTISTLTLKAEAFIEGDSVFDTLDKTIGYQFYINNRPVPIDVVHRYIGYDGADFVSVYATDNSVSTVKYSLRTAGTVLQNVGSYSIGLLLVKGDYACFGLATPNDEVGANFTWRNELPYFLRAGAVNVDRLVLDVSVNIPVGPQAFYSGASIKPVYTYYKGNEKANEISLQTELTDFVATKDMISYVLKREVPNSMVVVEVDEAIEAGAYTHQLAILEQYKANVAFGRIVKIFDGAQPDTEYNVSAAVVVGDRTRMTVTYDVSPLPLYVSYDALSSAFAQKGDFLAAYYGEVYKIKLSDIAFTSQNELGETIPVTHDFNVTMSVYGRLSGTTSRTGLVQDSDYDTVAGKQVFAAGSYTISIVFAPPVDEEEANLYAHYQLIDGMGLTEQNTLTAGSRFDVMFDVDPADQLRVVFKQQFESYTYDGNAKNFDIRFYVGQSDRTLDLEMGEAADYTITYSRYNNNTFGVIRPDEAVGASNSKVRYKVTVSFPRAIYRYAVSQYNGTYSHPTALFIPAGSKVEYEFYVVEPDVLSWGWAGDGNYMTGDGLQNLTLPYNGQAQQLKLRFVGANAYSDAATTVNLDLGTDYDIWYYSVSDDGYAKLAQAPTEIGDYLAELVFLQDMADFRYWNGTATESIYSYLNAEEASGRFGRSLMNHLDAYAALQSEKRYVAWSITKPVVTFTGLGSKDKTFDGKVDASVTTINTSRYTLSEGCDTLVDSDVAALWQLLRLPITGAFEAVGVGKNIPVVYRLKVGDLYLRLPHTGMLMGQSGVQYMLQQIALYEAQSQDNVALLADVKALLVSLGEHYDFCLNNVTASINRAYVTVNAADYSQVYNPDFDISGVIRYGLSTGDLALLHSLSVAGKSELSQAADYFVGSLTREDSDNASISEVGYPIILGDDFAFVPNTLTLIDNRVLGGTVTSSLGEQIDIRLNSARYYIRPCVITVDATLSSKSVGSPITRVYNDDDPALIYYVSQGSLLFMDELVYVDDQGMYGDGCNLYYQRTHSNKTYDDVGDYQVLYDHVRVLRYGEDVTENYDIRPTARTFSITPLSLVIYPVFGTYYINDSLTPSSTSISAIRRVVDSYGVPKDEYIPFDDILSGRYHATVSATYRREEAVNNDERIFKVYNVTLGAVRVVDNDGADLTGNFTFSLSEKTMQLKVSKYDVQLVVDADSVSKYFGEPDPIVPLSFRTGRDDYGFSIAEGSTPSRERGSGDDPAYDPVKDGGYKYKYTNEGTITILDGDGNDVTKYCYITVYEGTQYLTNLTLTIEPLPVWVTIRSETVYKTGKAIIPTIIYQNSAGGIISKAVVAHLKVKYMVEDVSLLLNEDQTQDELHITPRVADNSPESDDNFILTPKAGTLTVIYPWNVLSVEALEKENTESMDRQFAFVDGLLYKSLQVYEVTSLDGGKQTRTMQVKLPVTDALLEEDVYLICQRYDGSFVIREALYEDGFLVVSDDEFTYVMAVQRVYWPFIVAGVFVVLVLASVIGAVLYAKHRIKVRGKKERKPKVKKGKIKIKEEKPEESASIAPNADAKEESEDFDDIDVETAPEETEVKAPSDDTVPALQPDEVEVETVVSVDNDTLPPLTQESTAEDVVPEDKSDKKEKKEKKDKKEKKGKEETTFKPGSFAPNPSVAPKTAMPNAPIAPAPKPQNDTIGVMGSNTLPLPQDDDDEIVINTVTRRVGDDD